MEKVAIELKDRWGIDFAVLDPAKKYLIVTTPENAAQFGKLKSSVTNAIMPFLATPQIIIIDKVENFKLMEITDEKQISHLSKSKNAK